MRPILAEVVTIGDEILYGQITDTNTQWMSTELDKIGIKTVRKSSVGDQEDKILQILSESESRADIVLLTGGLGPTKDDITKKMLCKYFDDELVINEDALGFITDFFEKRGRPMTELNRKQAEVPSRCTYLANKTGTAPGMWFVHNGIVFVSMPGVPHEMKYLMSNEVIPRLKVFFETPIIYHKMIRTIGVGESFLAEKIESWEDNLPEHIKLAYLPSFGQVRLRLTAIGINEEQLKKEVDAEIEKVMPLIGSSVFGFDNDDLEIAIGKELKKRGLTVAAAESCTGGYIAHLLTEKAGASSYYSGSIISYSYNAKESLLDVNHSILETKGAVSEEVVIQMAKGALQSLRTDYTIAVSGIMGPDGGMKDKPVGTVWIAVGNSDKILTEKFTFRFDRTRNIELTATNALNMLRKYILSLS